MTKLGFYLNLEELVRSLWRRGVRKVVQVCSVAWVKSKGADETGGGGGIGRQGGKSYMSAFFGSVFFQIGLKALSGF